MKDQAGERYVASVYCRYGRDLQPYLEYIERLVDAVGGLPLIVSMDANAVSPMWHSKSVHRYGDAVARGREMENVIVRRGLYVLNGVEIKTWGESVRALLDELLPAGPTGSEQDRVTDPEVRPDKFSYSELNGAMRRPNRE
ncbi:Endonuclease-reverse transcriptase [Popillia japonica]|uniref:Endonuclease-reverse transcriptase n=1 Tax=Popillia japonica TaxID=7064 RepID=A0AAW1JDT5_POPJA